MKDGRELSDAKVKNLEIRSNQRYEKSIVEVTFDIPDGKGGREDLVVKYPIQGERHLVMLMHECDAGLEEESKNGRLDHNDILTLTLLVRELVGYGH